MTRRNSTSIAWDNVLGSLAPAGSKPTHATLVQGLTDWIDEGVLPRGVRLPSTRTIARKLGIGRNTVLFALGCLADNGYLESRERSGFFIGHIRPTRADGLGDQQDRAKGPDWGKRLQDRVFTTPNAHPLRASSEHDISFRIGGFDLELFPTSEWRECERAASGLREIAQWGRDMVDGDDPGLVEQIRTHILPLSGIWARPEEILITVGAQEGRYLVSRLLAGAGARIGIENPCSLDLARTVGITGAEVVGLDVDGQGAIPSEKMDACDAIIISPAHQNPTTVPLSVNRRRDILERAERHDFIVVEDTFETEFLHQRGAPPSLKSEDSSGRVIHIGTLSRLMAPGLRLGFVVAPAIVIDHLRMLRRLIHRHPPANNQRSLAIFIERGYYWRFVRRTAATLEQRSAALLSAAHRHLPDFRWRHQQGTSCFWCEMPTELDSEALAQLVRKEGVVIEPGTRFFQTDNRAANCLRLTVAGLRENQIEKGIQLIAESRRHLANSRQTFS